jgi:hypothetical protein
VATNNKPFLVKNGISVVGASGPIDVINSSGVWVGEGSPIGATGIAAASAGGVIYENSTTISSNYTLSTNKNGMSVGPISIDGGVTVTVPSGQRWVIL